MKIFPILFCLIVLTNCQNENFPTNISDDKTFGIYLLKDKNIKIQQINNSNINELKLETAPWLSSSDISFYDFSTHYIYLKKSTIEFFSTENDIKWDGQPFIVIANHKRCYAGCFMSIYSSVAVSTPIITEPLLQFLPSDILAISYGNLVNDTRNDANVALGLEMKNKLHMGLSLLIEDVNILSNSDTSIVQYSYTIKNNDADNLYILDPDKMGSNLFHFYMIGLSFHNSNTHLSSDYCEVVQPQNYGQWESEWFTKIKSGSTINRTVVLGGYPHIPAGTYNCSFYFSNPRNIEMEEREISDGRYWLGTIFSEVTIQVKE